MSTFATDAADAPRGASQHRQYEYRVVTLPREVTRSQARQLLTEQAEYGHWELARTRSYLGGMRKVWLRRRIIRQPAVAG